MELKEDKVKSICMVLVYFGEFPFWLKLTLETCRHNPTVNWLIVTDNSCRSKNVSLNVPLNVKIVTMSLEEFNVLLESKYKLGVKEYVLQDNTYKICDLKPSWGFVFKDYLKGYDFWGHGDLDVLYGDIRKFMTEDLLNEYEVICGHKRWICGHFNLYKNCYKINTLFKKVGKWGKIFAEYFRHSMFDEFAFSAKCRRLFEAGKLSIFWEKQFACENFLFDKKFRTSLAVKLKRLELKETCIAIEKRRWTWEKGKVFAHNREEYMYLHFLGWKHIWNSNKYTMYAFDPKRMQEKGLVASMDGFKLKEA